MRLQQFSPLLSLCSGLLLGLAVGILRNVMTCAHRDSVRVALYNREYLQQWQHTPQTQWNETPELNTSFLISMNDSHLHNDDDSIAKRMSEQVRILCWIMTSPKTLRTKAVHVQTTWSRRCNTVLFMSDVDDPDFPAVGLGTESGREHLTAKSMRAFDYVYRHHVDDADWFLKADDDTYVIVENLRYMLSAHAPSEPVYFGHHFRVLVEQGYHSGGAGYVLSREALVRFGRRQDGLCAASKGAEDVHVGLCMEKLGVSPGDSRDALNRTRFHCFPPYTHLLGRYPTWYFHYNMYEVQKGIDGISDYPVTFHYVSPDHMHELEYLVYHLNTYGLIRGLQPLNKPAVTSRRRNETDIRGE